MNRHGRAGLLSDLIPSMVSPQKPKQSEGGKGKQKEVPKSEEVRRLEGLKNRLTTFQGSETDPKGGCFCQGMSSIISSSSLGVTLALILVWFHVAREHTLSPFSPMCEQCGLILCDLNIPYYVCPHCSTPLHTPGARDTLIAKIEQELEGVLQKEAAERDRVVQEARKAEGQFPALPGTSSKTPSRSPSTQSLKTQTTQPAPQQQSSYKVLSLNPKSKKVVVTTRVKATSVPASVPTSQSKESLVAEPRRVPRPPPEVDFSPKSPDQSRPWAPLMRPHLTYVPPATLLDTEEQKKSTRSPIGA